MLGFITGSGFYDLPAVTDRDDRTVTTPYGPVTVTLGTWDATPVAFLPRHGRDHSVAPQQVNYRGNVWGLREIGVEAIVATAVSGGINPSLQPGDLVLLEDFLDWTTGRPSTFFDSAGDVRHTDMTEPYHRGLRDLLGEAAALEGIDLRPAGIYLCTNGPRFETRAEIRAAAALGADLVGMTGCPEVVLAAELGIPYASVGVISNPAAGLADRDISLEEIRSVLDASRAPLLNLFGRATGLWAQR
jgi:5'-methylthioadenosine phosphorylase